MFKKKTNKREIILIEDVSSIQSEALQKLQINIEFSSIDEKLKVLAITSSSQGEGKSTTIANLANLYALKGKKILLIDLDLRRPTVHYYFNLANEKGITDYCSDKVSEKELINKIKPGLDIIVRGEDTPFPTKVLESNKINDLINRLKDQYDYILLDTPPISVVSDALLVSRYAEGFVFVAEQSRTKKSDLKESLKVLKNHNVNLIGVVLTRVKVTKQKYNYYS